MSMRNCSGAKIFELTEHTFICPLLYFFFLYLIQLIDLVNNKYLIATNTFFDITAIICTFNCSQYKIIP